MFVTRWLAADDLHACMRILEYSSRSSQEHSLKSDQLLWTVYTDLTVLGCRTIIQQFEWELFGIMERLNIIGETMGLVLHLDYYTLVLVIQSSIF